MLDYLNGTFYPSLINASNTKMLYTFTKSIFDDENMTKNTLQFTGASLKFLPWSNFTVLE